MDAADFTLLEAALADLAGALDVGSTPDIARGVGRRLAGRRPAHATPRWWPWRPLPRAAAIALLILLLVAGLAAAAIGFGLPGLRFVFVGATPSPAPPSARATTPPATAPPATPATASKPPGSGSPTPAVATATPSAPVVDLGAPTTLAAARAAVDFGLYVPAAAVVGLEDPNVFVARTVPDGQVALVYPPDPARPLPSPLTADSAGRLIGLVITESRGSIDEGYFQKTIGPGTTVQPVVVNGRKGWWIAGRPHTIVTIDAAGQPNFETLRDIGDVLAWVQGGTVIRIESPLGLAETLRIAESME